MYIGEFTNNASNFPVLEYDKLFTGTFLYGDRNRTIRSSFLGLISLIKRRNFDIRLGVLAYDLLESVSFYDPAYKGLYLVSCRISMILDFDLPNKQIVYIDEKGNKVVVME